MAIIKDVSLLTIDTGSIPILLTSYKVITMSRSTAVVAIMYLAIIINAYSTITIV